MRVAVVGLGTAGSTLACLLADRGVDVVVLEQEDDPRPVGAGIWLQHLGQQVLDRLGLLRPLQEQSHEVPRVRIRTATGRSLVDVSYGDVPGSVPALGVHRGTLFSVLLAAVRQRAVPLELGVRVTGVRPVAGGLAVETASGDHGTYDLVVGCDGSRSRVRWSMGVAVRDHPYDYGALWSIVDDPDGLAADALFQCLRGTREYLGVLPTGLGRVSLFWSERGSAMPGVMSRGLPDWRAAARPMAAEFAPLLDRVDRLLPAALADYAAGRAAHVRWYQWWTRLMVPVFQSSLTPLAWPRDLFAPYVMLAPGMTTQMVTTLLGDRTSPWSAWRLPEQSSSSVEGEPGTTSPAGPPD